MKLSSWLESPTVADYMIDYFLLQVIVTVELYGLLLFCCLALFQCNVTYSSIWNIEMYSKNKIYP